MPKQPQTANYKPGDKIKYKHPTNGWVDAVFEGFHTQNLAPAGAKWSFIEITINGRSHNAYSLNQIKSA